MTWTDLCLWRKVVLQTKCSAYFVQLIMSFYLNFLREAYIYKINIKYTHESLKNTHKQIEDQAQHWIEQNIYIFRIRWQFYKSIDLSALTQNPQTQPYLLSNLQYRVVWQVETKRGKVTKLGKNSKFPSCCFVRSDSLFISVTFLNTLLLNSAPSCAGTGENSLASAAFSWTQRNERSGSITD